MRRTIMKRGKAAYRRYRPFCINAHRGHYIVIDTNDGKTVVKNDPVTGLSLSYNEADKIAQEYEDGRK